MTDEDERKAITEAMQRLLAGQTPQIIGPAKHSRTLAEEAGLKLEPTHKAHRPQGPLQRRAPRPVTVPPDGELRVRDETAALTRKINSA